MVNIKGGKPSRATPADQRLSVNNPNAGKKPTKLVAVKPPTNVGKKP